MNRAERRRQAKLARKQGQHRTPRRKEVTGFNVIPPKTYTDKVDFCTMLNAFRDEYFDGNSPFDVTPQYIDMMGHEQGIHRCMFFWDDELIAISECGTGVCYGKPTLGVATVYVKPSWRGKGIANSIYTYTETELMAGIPDCIFNLQIEEKELIANSNKFMKLGFTHAFHIEGFDNGLEYQQKTYAVMKGDALKGSTSLRSFSNVDMFKETA
jgi:hypothetical protein